jgi:uracil-DNA glycosylase
MILWKWHLGDNAKNTLTDTVAAWRNYLPAYLPLPYPSWRNNAWIKRNLWFEDEVLPELRDPIGGLLRHSEREAV